MPIPLLILSDAITARTGLGRIARDIATRVYANLSDVYRVGTFGLGAPASNNIGFMQYTATAQDEFLLPELPEVWDDFAHGQKGVVLSVWDPSRLMWLSTPDTCQLIDDRKYKGLRGWLTNAPFKKWIYSPVDGGGPNNRLTFSIMKSLQGFDRILAYTKWGRDVIENTISPEEATVRNLDNLPHGIDTNVFVPDPNRQLLRSVFAKLTRSFSIIATPDPLTDDSLLIGIVATNQARKDWGLGIETAALLAQKYDVRLWIHTDTLQRSWDIISLLIDFNLLGSKTMISLGHMGDDEMASAYSCCDVTLGIGPEGFGYPIAESLACGTPCVTGSYGGGAEIVPRNFQVEPAAFRLDGLHSIKRPVYRAEDFAASVEDVIGCTISLDPQFHWGNLWPRWEAWFRNAAKDLE